MADMNDATNDFPYVQYPEVEPLTKVVCDIGDVLLVADDGSHPPLRIQVSSVLLSTASKVFRTLFRGNFAEAAALRVAAESPTEIRVIDAPSDLLLLCQLLHFQGDLDRVGYQRFFELALIIDKYDCAQALRHVITSKFATLELSGVDQEEHVCYLAAAWILDQPKSFRDLSKEIVTHYEHGPSGMDYDFLEVLPDKVSASIHAQRAFAGQELVYHLSKFITKYHTTAFALEATDYSNELTQTMLGLNLWPLDLRETPLKHVFDELREYHLPVMQADILADGPNDISWGNFDIGNSTYNALSGELKPAKVAKPPTKFELVHAVERIELFCVGLCLDCLKGNDKCRVKHTDPFAKDLWIPRRRMRSDGGPDFGEDTERPVEWQSIW